MDYWDPFSGKMRKAGIVLKVKENVIGTRCTMKLPYQRYKINFNNIKSKAKPSLMSIMEGN
jgi:hypothetical protein